MIESIVTFLGGVIAGHGLGVLHALWDNREGLLRFAEQNQNLAQTVAELRQSGMELSGGRSSSTFTTDNEVVEDEPMPASLVSFLEGIESPEARAQLEEFAYGLRANDVSWPDVYKRITLTDG